MKTTRTKNSSIVFPPEPAGSRLPPTVIQRELDRILTSPRFRRAKRMSHFLRVLVEHGLKRGAPLEANEIAAQVFDKPHLDSRTDPIVRVEARRLRKLLSEYYENEGANDPVTVSLPSPGYRPHFTLNVGHGANVFDKENKESARPRKSVAVLPFLNMTNDPGQEVFCEGITEELINALTRIDDLRVASRTSAFQYKDPRDIREIGRDLGVSAVLEGSIRMAEKRVRVTAQLSSAADGFHLCSETFDAEFEQNFALQERLAAAIATMADRML